jgi:hypothetical protein
MTLRSMRPLLVSAVLLSTATALAFIADPVAAANNREKVATERLPANLGTAMLYAVVNADGSLARRNGAGSSARLGLGTYEVIFSRNVRDCVYTATIGLSGASGSSNPGEITVVGRATNVKGVFVTTHDSAGADADRGFHLVVNC